ncbi:MAG: transposase [Xenococcaceae cyanobacterium MO_188.B19]|nr:transposase [Xenococcaceae cyanobacterium MO_188.B19]MDJ0682413.1 transposase [Xenococcaceae cyanobacterium MO_167.B52]
MLTLTLIYTYQYRLRPTTEQKLVLNDWLRICRYWYNRQLGERFDWWEQNRTYTDSCPLVCHLPELKDKPDYYNQKKQLPIIKQDLVSVGWSKELLDFTVVPSQTLQEVCKRVKLAFNRYISGDKNGKRSGKPRFKNQARFRSMVFEGAKLHSCSVGGKFLYLSLPKLGVIKARYHRVLPDGAVLKQAQLIKKADGWYINLRLEDKTIPNFATEINPTWENSIGMDAVLHENDYLATSEGFKLPSLKSFRNSQSKLARISRRKSSKKKGSKARRKLAKKEAKIHQQVARARKDHAYNIAHQLLRTGKTIFFYEKLNLKGLTKRNNPKQDELGRYLPNGQSRKSGLSLSWNDAAFAQFFSILGYIAEKAHRPRRGFLGVRTEQEAGAKAIEVNPAYTSQLLSYKDEFVFTECSIREYWDEELNLLIDRDINSSINLKRRGLDLFPRIKRRKGNPVVTKSATNITLKEVLLVHQLWATQKPA